MPFIETWMDLEISIPSEVSQTNIWYHLYVNLKYDANEPVYEAEIESQTYKIDWWLPRGRRWEEE